MNAGWVVIEWSQAGGGPALATDEIFDSEESAVELAKQLRDVAQDAGRRDMYCVHVLGEEVAS